MNGTYESELGTPVGVLYQRRGHKRDILRFALDKPVSDSPNGDIENLLAVFVPLSTEGQTVGLYKSNDGIISAVHSGVIPEQLRKNGRALYLGHDDYRVHGGGD